MRVIQLLSPFDVAQDLPLLLRQRNSELGTQSPLYLVDLLRADGKWALFEQQGGNQAEELAEQTSGGADDPVSLPTQEPFEVASRSTLGKYIAQQVDALLAVAAVSLTHLHIEHRPDLAVPANGLDIDGNRVDYVHSWQRQLRGIFREQRLHRFLDPSKIRGSSSEMVNRVNDENRDSPLGHVLHHGFEETVHRPPESQAIRLQRVCDAGLE